MYTANLKITRKVITIIEYVPLPISMPLAQPLKLVRTYLNCRVLGTSTAAIFLSNDRFLYAPITSDLCHT